MTFGCLEYYISTIGQVCYAMLCQAKLSFESYISTTGQVCYAGLCQGKFVPSVRTRAPLSASRRCLWVDRERDAAQEACYVMLCYAML